MVGGVGKAAVDTKHTRTQTQTHRRGRRAHRPHQPRPPIQCSAAPPTRSARAAGCFVLGEKGGGEEDREAGVSGGSYTINNESPAPRPFQTAPEAPVADLAVRGGRHQRRRARVAREPQGVHRVGVACVCLCVARCTIIHLKSVRRSGLIELEADSFHLEQHGCAHPPLALSGVRCTGRLLARVSHSTTCPE